MEKRKGKVLPIILISVFAFLLAVTLVVDILIFGVFGDQLDKAFVAVKTDEEKVAEATANGLAVAEDIQDEGTVLLENNGALPLAVSSSSATPVNLLGYRAYDPVYGGTGSGGSSYDENRVDFSTALNNAGFAVNPDLAEVYEDFASGGGNTFAVNFSVNEPAATQDLATAMEQDYIYTGDASFDAMKEYSDIAIVVIARAGGEGNDLPVSMAELTEYAPDQAKHYLELNSAEQSLIDNAKATFGTVIIVINSSNAMELGFIEDGDGGKDAVGDVDAALWIGGPGDVGFVSVANVLKGSVNPSGRTADIYPYAVETIPSYYNFGEFEYTNSVDSVKRPESSAAVGKPAYLIEYQEGIYVGYKYYETRTSYDYTTREGEERTGLDYDDVVQYPFGYGLSYTDFSWEVSGLREEGTMNGNTEFTVTVDVTNNGDVAGKDVVEVYVTAPYRSASAGGSGIQKSAVTLVGFAKTELIQPEDSAEVEISFTAEDLASYDDLKYYSTTGSYVLEEGDYVISVRSDSHTVKGGSYTYTLEENVVFNDEENAKGVSADFVGKRESDAVLAVNRFDDARGEVEYMTRDSWNIVPGTDREATAEQLEAFENALVIDESEYVNASDVAPVLGADHGEDKVVIEDLFGKDYDDPLWEDLLDQLTLDDMRSILGANGWGCKAIDSIGLAQIYDMDGPSGISYVFDAFMGTVTYETVRYPGTVVLASSWNTALGTAFGDAISKEGDAWKVSGWYAPGANIHRNPFLGRNFEYYSEDGELSAAMCGAVVGAAQDNGMYCYVKHFALNELELNRHYGLCTWSTEQAMREIYFRPFEAAVKDGNSTGMMSSYNNIGTTWAGASKALLTDVLRNEWGFEGTVLTDNNEEHGFMSIEKAILAGGTTLLYGWGTKQLETLSASASGQLLMREACHRYLYTVGNSYAVGYEYEMPFWRKLAIGLSVAAYVIFAAGVAAGVVILVKRGKSE